jgi:hypothetical protein
MDDPQIQRRIQQLIAEAHTLWQREATGDASERDRQRLGELNVSLGQCWDPRREKGAPREGGRAPDVAYDRPRWSSVTSSSARPRTGP